jgi:adenylyltransferase/sulfurtransferase
MGPDGESPRRGVSRSDAERIRYRRLFVEAPATEDAMDSSKIGILGAIPGVVGSPQALEAIKYVTGVGELPPGRLLVLDGLQMTFRTITVRKNDACKLCGNEPAITSLC